MLSEYRAGLKFAIERGCTRSGLVRSSRRSARNYLRESGRQLRHAVGERSMVSAIGWYVRVTTTEVVDGEPQTVLYVVGHPTPEECKRAVKEARASTTETYEVLGAALPQIGPQPKPGQLWVQ
jgi:hypothetical protein